MESTVLERTSPRIFYLGFEMDQIDFGKFFSHHFCAADKRSSQFIVQNLHRSVDNNPNVFSIYYNAIAGELNDFELFEIMSQKFPKICRPDLSGNVADEKRLLKFMEKFKIKDLTFVKTSLSQPLFEKLAENSLFIRNIQRIRIDPETITSILPDDFDFVLKFKHLISLSIVNCPLSLNFVARLLEQLESIQSIEFWQLDHEFSLSLDSISIRSRHPEFSYFKKKIHEKSALQLVNDLKSRLKPGEIVCPKELQIQLRRIEFENQTYLSLMKKCICEQTNSICLS